MTVEKINSKSTTIVIAIFVLIISIISIGGYYFYSKIYFPNVKLQGRNETFILIPTGSSFNEVHQILIKEGVLKDPETFEWVAEQMGYPEKVKPGKYTISDNMNNKELIYLLRSGRQTPVKVVFNTIRSVEQLSSVISKQIEADSASLTQLLNTETFLKQSGLTTETVLTVFLPNTYEFYWNTGAIGFFKRMQKESAKFWNEKRIAKAQQLGMSPVEVSVLASIVEQETNKNDEKQDIAGVYINRLRKNWKLEADPTLVYAAGDFGIKRVLNIHKEIDSPYNTYKNTGLPPGPICVPSIASIEAVLNHSNHSYMFFCAKDDFSGYHSFASNYNEHLVNARKFQRELNRRKIKS